MENIRPAIITLLCILTFVGSSIMLYTGVTIFNSSDIMPGQFEEALDIVKEQLNQQQNEETTEEALQVALAALTSENLRSLGLAMILSNILTIIGGVFMWGLQKKGFYIYLAGNLLLIFSPIFIFGPALGSGFSILFGFFSFIFIILYAVNVKHLK